MHLSTHRLLQVESGRGKKAKKAKTVCIRWRPCCCFHSLFLNHISFPYLFLLQIACMLDWDHKAVRAWLESNGWTVYFKRLGEPLGKHLASASHVTILNATTDKVTGMPNRPVAEYMFNEITHVLDQNLADHPERSSALKARISARGESSSDCPVSSPCYTLCTLLNLMPHLNAHR